MKYTETQIEELEAQIKRVEVDSRFFKRVQVAYWLANSRDIAEIMEWSGLSQRTIYRIYKAYQDSGLKGFRANYKANNRKLSEDIEERTLNEIAKEMSGGFVRVSEIQKIYEAKTGIHYNDTSNFYRLLHRHKWRKVMPRKEHPKSADEATCAASKKLTLWSRS